MPVLHSEPVHARPHPVVVREVFRRPDRRHHRAFVVNEVVASLPHEVGVDSLEEIENNTLALRFPRRLNWI